MSQELMNAIDYYIECKMNEHESNSDCLDAINVMKARDALRKQLDEVTGRINKLDKTASSCIGIFRVLTRQQTLSEHTFNRAFSFYDDFTPEGG